MKEYNDNYAIEEDMSEFIQAAEEEDDFAVISEENIVSVYTPLYTSRQKVESFKRDAEDVINQLDILFERLKEGNITETLSTDERNDIIDNIKVIIDEFDVSYKKTKEELDNNFDNIKGLKLTTNIDLSKFDKLLSTDPNKDLDINDINFQEQFI